ncbi:MAG: FAD-dependent oxidoreductase, partial [Bacilli bacterium]|nr:FAD-dependent oxidoreductase [Bacilli bacterium]
IGTDYLRIVIKNMREKIISMGGEFLFNSKMTDIILENGKVKEIEINKERKIPCDVLLLAIGHSSRDTFYLLKDKGVLMKNKNFAIGVRVEHPQEMINKNQYKEKYHLLPPASYKLTYQTKDNRGVYSFCMCPGGFVVNASSENNRLTINGMSNYKRDEKNANSAIVVSITEKDYGNNLLDGVKYQRELEEKAYRIGEGKIPIQLLEDFYKNEKTKELKEITPNTKGSYQFANLNDCLPKEICDAIKEAFFDFSKKIKGFNRGDCILSAIEARTSSPIRILRDEYFESNIKGIYPSGEGAGYAGGITTSAMDGFKVAESIIKRYN